MFDKRDIPRSRYVQCNDCQHRIVGSLKCKAFSARIPKEILTGQHDHRNEYEGDNGYRFLPKNDT